MDRLRSVRNLALLTIQPLEGTVFAVLGALALVGLPTAVATRYTGLAACVTFLAVLAALLAVAGYKLQRQHDQRMRPAFTLELRLEDLAGELVRNSGEYFDMRTGLIVRVTNSGPDAEFVARVENVTGARRFGTRKPLDVRYSVDHVAWIETANSRMLITRGQTASLRLAEAAMLTHPHVNQPFAIYFWQAATEAFNPHGHGAGWLLDGSSDGTPITFDLTVTNVTAGTAVTERFGIWYDDNERLTFGTDPS